MLCISITGLSLEEFEQKIIKAIQCADLVELRLDTLKSIDIDALRALRKQFDIPMIFTLRKKEQESGCDEEKRMTMLLRLAALGPDFIDVEIDTPRDFIETLFTQYPKIKLILSYHNFTSTPSNNNLDELFHNMQQISAAFYKIAVYAHNTLDALRLLNWSKQGGTKLIAISMGTYGQVSRILGTVLGSPMTYACIDENHAVAPGQIPASVLLERYRYRSLSSNTCIYGLIGDPVDLSVSDHTHNRLFGTLDVDAVYVKMRLAASELPDFLQLAKQLPFKGLSVTMPLKECIMPYLDFVDAEACEIGAVNTLVLQHDNAWEGFNTDGIGALNAIQKITPVQNMKIAILGAGGAAKAIAYEAHRRGAAITIINRDITRANQLAQKFQATASSFEQVSCAILDYDVLINCTPVSMPVAADSILSKSIVMDIKTRPIETPFLKSALEKGCRIIPGYHMFIEQALGQFNLWFCKPLA